MKEETREQKEGREKEVFRIYLAVLQHAPPILLLYYFFFSSSNFFSFQIFLFLASAILQKIKMKIKSSFLVNIQIYIS